MYLNEEQKHKIRLKMFERKLSVIKIAEKLGKSRNAWHQKLAGKTIMDSDDIIKLSKLLGISKNEVGNLFFNWELFSEIREERKFLSDGKD